MITFPLKIPCQKTLTTTQLDIPPTPMLSFPQTRPSLGAGISTGLSRKRLRSRAAIFSLECLIKYFQNQ
jgi:hypothetical protein